MPNCPAQRKFVLVLHSVVKAVQTDGYVKVSGDLQRLPLLKSGSETRLISQQNNNNNKHTVDQVGAFFCVGGLDINLKNFSCFWRFIWFGLEKNEKIINLRFLLDLLSVTFGTINKIN